MLVSLRCSDLRAHVSQPAGHLVSAKLCILLVLVISSGVRTFPALMSTRCSIVTLPQEPVPAQLPGSSDTQTELGLIIAKFADKPETCTRLLRPPVLTEVLVTKCVHCP
jgi:hypothetical protein